VDSTQQPNTVMTQQMFLKMIANIRDMTAGTKFYANGRFQVTMWCEYVKVANEDQTGKFEWIKRLKLDPQNIIDIYEGQTTQTIVEHATKIRQPRVVDIYPDKHFRYDNNGNCTNCYGDETITTTDKTKDKVTASLKEDEDLIPPSIKIEDVLTLDDFEVKLQVEFGDNSSEKYVSVKAYYRQMFGKDPQDDKTMTEIMELIIEENQSTEDRISEANANIASSQLESNTRKKRRKRIRDKAKGK